MFVFDSTQLGTQSLEPFHVQLGSGGMFTGGRIQMITPHICGAWASRRVHMRTVTSSSVSRTPAFIPRDGKTCCSIDRDPALGNT